MDVRNLNTQDLENFLYEYSVSLDSYNKIVESYNELIDQAHSDYQKYYQKENNNFEKWKNHKVNQNLNDVKFNEIPHLKKKRDSTQNFRPIILGILGVIIGFFIEFILEIIMIHINGFLSFLLSILCFVIGYNTNKIKTSYYNKKINKLINNAQRKDLKSRLSEDTLKNEYGIKNRLNEIYNIYNNFIQKYKENFKHDTFHINAYLNELENALPKNHKRDLVLASNLYIYVHEGRASNWKEALNLYHEDVKHNEVMSSMNILSKILKSGVNRIENVISETNYNVKQVTEQVETANQNIEKLKINYNDVSNEMINLQKKSLNELAELNPNNRKSKVHY